MGVAVFDYALWVATYPEFTSVTEPMAQAQFDAATLFLDNTDCSPVTNVSARLTLLNMITAHLVKLFTTVAGQAPSGLVGRVTSATEGSVTVTAEFVAAKNALEAWWLQTPYGAMYWAATAGYRTMRYVPGPRPFLGSSRASPYGYGGRWPR